MNKHTLSVAITFLFCTPISGGIPDGIYHKGWIDFNKNGKMDLYENPKAPLEDRVQDLLSQMTLEEKTCQMATLYGSGRVLKDALPQNNWKTEVWKDGIGNIDEEHNGLGAFKSEYSFPYAKHVNAKHTIQRWFVEKTRLGIPVDFTNEGIRGLCHDRATYFPAQCGQGATWNKKLIARIGEVEAKEAVALGYTNIYSPILDIAQDPRWGRCVETYGEDPYLVSQMVSQYVTGLQSTGTAACLKHFYGNNTEFYRKRSNSIISERAMNEIYLPGFKAGIDAGAMSVMTSYNQIDGEWTGQSSYVIKNILREKLGFKWLVMSDWNSVWNLEKVIKSGQNLEMPGSYNFGESVLGLYHQKKITEKDLDDMVRPILATCIAMGFYDRSKYDLSLLDKYQEHEKIARQVAEEGIVLLKNRDNILPLDPTKNRKILLTGKFIYEIPRGYGAAEVIGYNNVSLIEALQRAFGRTVYYIEKPTVADIKEADIVLLSMGTRDKEAIERPFALPKEDESLMRYVTKNNPNTIAILNTGSAIDMSAWNDRLAGLIYGWYGGQSGFEALTDIITGKVTPSGKLPMTIEKTFEDSPAWGYLPKGASLYNELKNEHLINVYDVNYGESVLVGYRWYDTKNIEPLYPFGYGLSYTTFTLTKPRLSSKKMNDQMIRCSVTITNTGSQKGAEVIQLYLKENQPSVLRPEKELKRFKKIFLNSGENQTVEFEITPEDLAFWDDETHDWKVNSGQYSILLGTSSRHISHILSFTKE